MSPVVMIRQKAAFKLIALATIVYSINNIIEMMNFINFPTKFSSNENLPFHKLTHFKTLGNYSTANNTPKTMARKQFFLKPFSKDPYDPKGAHPAIMNPPKYVIDLAHEELHRELKATNASMDSIHQTLILGYWRSGSTFLGELLNELPGNFYHYEPLHELSPQETISALESEIQAVDIILKLLNCEFGDIEEFTEWVDNPELLELMRHNIRFWRTCHNYLPVCSNANIISNICKLFPRHLMKTVRLRVKPCRRLLAENTGLQIIHLVRDPRAIFSSRKEMDWCFDNCLDAKILCDEMLADLANAVELQEEFPDRFVTLRFEDLASDPLKTMKILLEFLDAPFDATVEKVLQTHTNTKEISHSPYNTKKNSRAIIFKWMEKLDKTEIVDIQDSCQRVMNALHYPVITYD